MYNKKSITDIDVKGKTIRDGIIHTWSRKEDNTFFQKANHTREGWQRTLYQRIFTDDNCVLKHINQLLSDNKKPQYITLSQLFEKCRNDKGDVVFEGASDAPIFMFWHAGIAISP